MKRRLVYLMGIGVLCSNARAQSLDKPLQLASREPAFYAIIGSHLERAEVRNVAVLRERIAVSLHNATIPEALNMIEMQTSLRFAFKPSILPPGATVSLDARDITVAAALTQILLDADVDVEIAPYGLASIVARPRHSEKSDAATGTITGRVIDSKTHAALPYATISVEGTSRTVTASDSGTFQILGLQPGTYILTIRRLGYLLGHRTVALTSGEIATVDCDLEQSASVLDQVVVAGTFVPAEVKSLPTPVTVIGDSTIAQQEPFTVMEVFRQFVPTAVAFDQPSLPYNSSMTVRGASDLNGTPMKVLIDGVETTSGANAPIDPSSIDRIEVIRGPEAAAIYGSGAIDGVIEIFTKRGNSTLQRPQVDVEVSGADVQTPYPGFRDIVRQKYVADLRGNGSNTSYDVGGSYSETNNYIPRGEYSAMSEPSVHGGVSYAKGIVSVDLSGRYYVINAPVVFNPLFYNSGLGYFSKPFYQSTQFTYETVGSTFGLQPTSWWRNSFTIGLDRYNADNIQRRARLTSASDTELSVNYQTASKTSLAYNSSATARITPDITGTLTVGADYWNTPGISVGSSGVYNVKGNITTDPNQPFGLNRNTTWNTGLFAQTQVGFYDALFLTAGLRAEWNPDWGDSIGVPLSPRLGLAYTHSVGSATIKLRSSWGIAILPPPPQAKLANVTTSSITLANQHLGPEHQRGGDVGFDLVVGSHGSLGVTYYNQTALDFIQTVTLPPSNNLQVYQTENVGNIHNTGVELEGTLNFWRASLRGVYGYARSRVDQLEPDYQGDLRISDQVFDYPLRTGGGSLAFRPWHGTEVSTGITYVGGWTDYDYLREFRCYGGNTSACTKSGTSRSYLIMYPSFVKGRVAITQHLNHALSVFLSADNIGDNQQYETNNYSPVFGRITTIGLRLHY